MSGSTTPSTYVYICSAGHSGSTLLDLLIGSHPQIASLGEIDQLSKNIALNTECSCGSPVRECAVWQEVTRRVGEQIGVDVLADPYALHMGYPKASVVVDRQQQTKWYLARREVLLGLYYLHLLPGGSILHPLTGSITAAIDNNVRVFEAVRSVLDVQAVVDSSKSYLKAIALYRRHPDRVKLLLLTRDGRGVYWSNLKRGGARRRIVRDWRNQYARALPLLRRHVPADRMLQVRYEDLAADTRGVLEQVCGFIGLPFDSTILDFRSKTHHLANGNDMRLRGSSSVRLDEEWRQRLSEDDLGYFEQKAGWLNRQLGYV